MQWFELIGWLGALLLLVSRWMVDVVRSRQIYLLSMVLLVLYTVSGRMWALVVVFVLLVVTEIWRARRLNGRADDDDQPGAGFSVIEIGPLDEYLRYLLRVHGKDILEYQPGFVWDGAAPGKRAALVQLGAETVGILLFRRVDPDVAALELDYVTPRFRNAGPGKYVFFDSGFFHNLGFRTILTPPLMRQAYYHRLGFTRDGDHYVHEVPAPVRRSQAPGQDD